MGTIITTRFKEVEYKEEDVICFINGLPGFENEENFIIIKLEQNNPIAFLQSTKTPDLAFVITDPFTFYHDYEFILADNINEELEVEESKEIAIWNILSVPSDFKKSTINLKAPIIINVSKRLGKQVILNEDYLIKAPLFPNKEGGE